jgi:hypothetical protein
MDSRTLKMAKVFDFGKVRLVTVVTWVEETDAEAEGSGDEKGYGGFQLTLLRNVLILL